MRFRLDPTPGFSRNFRNAREPGKLIAQGLNRLTGGDEFVPDLFSRPAIRSITCSARSPAVSDVMR